MSTATTRYRWTGDLTGDDHSVEAEVSTDDVDALPVNVSTDYGGRDDRWNPETLLGAALCDCYMATFLAIAKKARLDVRAIDARADLPVEAFEGKRERISHVDLQARITVAEGTDADKVKTIFDKAHKYCVVANTLGVEVRSSAEVEVGQ